MKKMKKMKKMKIVPSKLKAISLATAISIANSSFVSANNEVDVSHLLNEPSVDVQFLMEDIESSSLSRQDIKDLKLFLQKQEKMLMVKEECFWSGSKETFTVDTECTPKQKEDMSIITAGWTYTDRM